MSVSFRADLKRSALNFDRLVLRVEYQVLNRAAPSQPSQLIQQTELGALVQVVDLKSPLEHSI